MPIGLVMTIRNERPMLRRNLLYHRYLGVDKMYVYLDNCTDGSETTVEDLPYVSVGPNVDPELLRNHPGAEVYIQHPDHITARHSLNVIHTIDLAAAEGLDWLINIDPDELICPHADSIERDDLKRFFASIDADAESVLFMPFESCARRMEYADVFSEETLFTPPGAKGTREVFDPMDGSTLSAELMLGHYTGKCAIRPVPGIVPRGPHDFVRPDRSRLRTEVRGLLLHYYLSGFSHFIRKFRNFSDRPDTWVSGKKVRQQKRLWRDLVNKSDFSEEQLRAYFERWVLVSPEEVSRRLRGRRILGIPVSKPTLVEIQAASNAFKTVPDLT